MGLIPFFLSPLFYVLALFAFKESKQKVTIDCNVDEVITNNRGIVIKQIFLIALAFAGVMTIILDSALYEYEYDKVSALYGVRYLDWGDGEMSLIFSWMEGVVMGITLFVYLFKLPFVKQDCLDEKRMLDDKERTRKAEYEKKKKHYDEVLKELQDQYGKMEKILDPVELIPEKSVIAFSLTKTMYIQGTILPFDKIIGYSLLDNSKQVTTTSGTMIGETSANSSSVIGRSLVGGLIGGEAGAIIGGATASTTTFTDINSSSTTSTHHDYSIKMQIADIARPILTIQCGTNETVAYELIGLINAILSINKQ